MPNFDSAPAAFALPRLVFCGLALTWLNACAPASRPPAEVPARRYHGLILDARTGAPVPHASVTAYHQPFSVPFLLPPDDLGFTQSREDGSFDLTIPAARKLANHFEATANVPLSDPVHPRRGELSGYHGVLDHVSLHRTNTVFVHPIHSR